MKETESAFNWLADGREGSYQACLEDGSIVWINQPAANLLGYSSVNQVLGRNDRDLFVHPSDHEKFIEAVKNEQVVRDQVLLIRRRDGTVFYAEMTGVLIKDREGRPVRVEGIFRTLSEKQETEGIAIVDKKRLFLDDTSGGHTGTEVPDQ